LAQPLRIARRSRGARSASPRRSWRWLRTAPSAYQALGSYYRLIARDQGRAREEYAKGLKLAPGNFDLVRGIGRSGEGISNIRGKIVLRVKDIQL
jgi:hypothetical protein